MNKTKIGFSLLGIALIGGGIGLLTSLVSCSKLAQGWIDLIDIPYNGVDDMTNKRLVFDRTIDWVGALDGVWDDPSIFGLIVFRNFLNEGDLYQTGIFYTSTSVDAAREYVFIGDFLTHISVTPTYEKIHSYYNFVDEGWKYSENYEWKNEMILNFYSSYTSPIPQSTISPQILEDAGLRGWCKVFDK